jgi:hypothetical protein
MSYYKTTDFWTKIKDSCAIGTFLTEAGMTLGDASDFWRFFVLSAGFTGYLIGIWMTDKNNNGIVDPFEEK